MNETVTRTARAACSAQSLRNGSPKVGATIHYTEGRAYSRTGRNLIALCGANVRPEAIGKRNDYKPCRECSLRSIVDRIDIVVIEVDA